MTLWNRYDHAFFESIADSSQHSAQKIVPLVLSLLQANSVVDVGCGDGSWLAEFRRHGIDDVQGLDGDYVPADVMKIPTTSLIRYDLSRPFSLDREFDLAICLETGEHLPETRAAGLVADHPDLCDLWDGFGFREVLGMLPLALKKAIGRRLHSRAA